MADNERIMQFANFNVTYGKSEEPMLIHFSDIIYPSFQSKYVRGKEFPKFYFSDIEIKEFDDEYALVGNIIKETEYKVYTTIQEGELKSSPSNVPTAPYSRFIVFLENHRMVLVRNEQAGPDVRSFQRTVRDMIDHFIRETNKVKNENPEKLPSAIINIVDIPLRQNIAEVLRTVKKIKRLNIKFFPLNNDINPLPLFDNIHRERKKLSCKRANLDFPSPQSKPEVKNLIERSAGLAATSLEVIDENGNNATIKEDKFTSSKKIQFDGNIQPSDDLYIVSKAKEDGVVSFTSDANKAIYSEIKPIIRQIYESRY